MASPRNPAIFYLALESFHTIITKKLEKQEKMGIHCF